MRWGDKLLCSSVFTAWLAVSGSAIVGPVAGRDPVGRVELVCRLKASSDSLGAKDWRISIFNAAGQPAGRAVAQSGETATFKNLKPGVHKICIRGDRTDEQCESVDLTLPAGRDFAQFVRDLNMPPVLLNQPGLYCVHVSKLLVPPSATKEMLKADSALTRGEMQKFIQHAERALELYPQFSRALNNLGVYWHHRREFNLAIQYFTKVTEIDPKDQLAWTNLAASLLSVGQPEAAIKAGREALTLLPNCPDTIACIALAYFRLREFEDSEKYFKLLLALDPANAANPQLHLYRIALDRQNKAQAAEYLRSFLCHHPNSPLAAKVMRWLDELVSERLTAQSETRP